MMICSRCHGEVSQEEAWATIGVLRLVEGGEVRYCRAPVCSSCEMEDVRQELGELRPDPPAWLDHWRERWNYFQQLCKEFP